MVGGEPRLCLRFRFRSRDRRLFTTGCLTVDLPPPLPKTAARRRVERGGVCERSSPDRQTDQPSKQRLGLDGAHKSSVQEVELGARGHCHRARSAQPCSSTPTGWTATNVSQPHARWQIGCSLGARCADQKNTRSARQRPKDALQGRNPRSKVSANWCGSVKGSVSMCCMCWARVPGRRSVRMPFALAPCLRTDCRTHVDRHTRDWWVVLCDTRRQVSDRGSSGGAGPPTHLSKRDVHAIHASQDTRPHTTTSHTRHEQHASRAPKTRHASRTGLMPWVTR